MTIEPWKVLSSETVFEHRWYHLRKDEVKLQDGTVLNDYFVSVRPDVVLIYAETENAEVILVRQYKHAGGEIYTELPGGFIEEGHKALESAKRELKEETGYTSDEWEKLAVFTDNPTKDTTKIHVFRAGNCRKTSVQELDPTENIEVLIRKKQHLVQMIKEGEIKVSASVAAIFLAEKD